MNEELAMCAKINFDNFEKAFSIAKHHPYYMIAKAQLDEALGGRPTGEAIEAALSPAPNPQGEDE